MKKLVTTIILIAALSGCAHSDLKAPCSPLSSLSATDKPGCNPKPVNVADVEFQANVL